MLKGQVDRPWKNIIIMVMANEKIKWKHINRRHNSTEKIIGSSEGKITERKPHKELISQIFRGMGANM